jgi:hypothetical protein
MVCDLLLLLVYYGMNFVMNGITCKNLLIVLPQHLVIVDGIKRFLSRILKKFHDNLKSGKRPLSSDGMEYIVNKSKKVIVLNPEPRNKWNVVDSCVSYYEDSGAEFFEVRNLEQLTELITFI